MSEISKVFNEEIPIKAMTIEEVYKSFLRWNNGEYQEFLDSLEQEQVQELIKLVASRCDAAIEDVFQEEGYSIIDDFQEEM